MVAASGMTPAHITLGVSDLGASEHFYRDVLGFSVKRTDESITVDLAGFSLILESAPPVGRAKFSMGFRIADASLDDLAGRVRAGGGHILAGPAPREAGGRALLLMDPDHYQLEIFSE
jgi:catechol 2,3-dioxygenase-like lactoylglutathione lyase family enzyme